MVPLIVILEAASSFAKYCTGISVMESPIRYSLGAPGCKYSLLILVVEIGED